MKPKFISARWGVALTLALSAAAQAQVTPTLTLSSTGITAGGSVTATADNLPCGGSYTLAWGDNTSQPIDGFSLTGCSMIPGQGGVGSYTTDAHTYSAAGVFTVTLSDDVGNVLITPVQQNVVVTAQSFGLLKADAVTGQAGQAITLNLSGLTVGQTYKIDWGDTTSTNLTASATTGKLTHTYSGAGTYAVSITNTAAAQDFTTTTATITSVPVNLSPSATELTATLTMSNLTVGTNYTIDWGDTSNPTLLTATATTAQLTHKYLQAKTYTVQVTATGMTPAITTVTTTPPRPTLNPVAGAVGQASTLNLSNLSAGTTYTISWGDGSSGTLTATADTAQVSHTYLTAGTFTVNVTAPGTPTASTTMTTTVNPVTASIGTVGFGQAATLSLSNLTVGVTYTIEWGDGTTSSFTATAATSQVNHTYNSAAGDLTVRVTAPAMTPVTTTVRVLPPQATASIPSQQVAGEPAILTLNNLVVGYSYTINWGDNKSETFVASATSAAVPHTYTSAGQFFVNLSARDMNPVTNSVTVIRPTVLATVTTAPVGQSTTLKLTKLVSGYTYTVNWGDGSYPETFTATSPTRDLTHAYAAPRDYFLEISSQGLQPTSVTATIQLPLASATAPAVQLGQVTTLNLSNLATGFTYTVNWGDGKTDTLTASGPTGQLTHTYANPGTFTIQVIAAGMSDVTATTSVAATGAVGQVELSVTAAASGQGSTLTLTRLTPGVSYLITWGDGAGESFIASTDSAQLTHTYRAGTFDLRVSAPGMTPDATTRLTVAAPPARLITQTQAMKVTLSLLDLAPGVMYAVDWGDGQQTAYAAVQQQGALTHDYATPGTYAISVTAAGMSVPSIATVTTSVGQAQIIPQAGTLNSETSLQLRALSVGITYLIDWGDGLQVPLQATSADMTVRHTYTRPGAFLVQVSAGGTVSTASLTVNTPTVQSTVAVSDLTVSLQVSNTVNGERYTVDWGDGKNDAVTATGSTLQLSHTYNPAGNWAGGAQRFQMQVTNPAMRAVNTPVTVYAPSVTIKATPGTAGQSTRLELGNLIKDLAYTVDWGDGTTSTVTVPDIGLQSRIIEHTYAARQAAPYRVTVRSQRGIETALDLTLRPQPVQLALTPTALDVVLQLKDFVPGTTYQVNWGDGTDTTELASYFQHTYAKPGTYTVSVASAGAATVSANVEVKVPTPGFMLAADVKALDFMGTVALDNLLKSQTYTIDWGDGTQVTTITGVTETRWTHKYLKEGTYTVTVSGAFGKRSRDGTYKVDLSKVKVAAQPQDIDASKPFETNGGDYKIVITGLAATGKYLLDYGDGTTQEFVASTPNVVFNHVYRKDGIYAVKVTTKKVDGTVIHLSDTKAPITLNVKAESLAAEFSDPAVTGTLTRQDLSPFTASLKMTYTGTGTIVGDWLLDGKSIKRTTLNVKADSNDVTTSVVIKDATPGPHTLVFKPDLQASPLGSYVQNLTTSNSLSFTTPAAPTITFGNFTMRLRDVKPGTDGTLSGRAILNLRVAGSYIGDYEVPFSNLKYTLSTGTQGGQDAGYVAARDATVKISLNDAKVTVAALGDQPLILKAMTFTGEGARVDGALEYKNLPYSFTQTTTGGATTTTGQTTVGSTQVSGSLTIGSNKTTSNKTVTPGSTATLPFTGATLDPDGGFLAKLNKGTLSKINVDDLILDVTSSDLLLDLSTKRNQDNLDKAYTTAQNTDWMGLLAPRATLTAPAGTLRSAEVNLTVVAAQGLTGWNAVTTVQAGTVNVGGWDVDSEESALTVTGSHLGDIKNSGTIDVPMIQETFSVNVNRDQQTGEWDMTVAQAPKEHDFGTTKIILGDALFTDDDGQLNLVFPKAKWSVGKVFLTSADGQEITFPLSMLTITGEGDVSLYGRESQPISLATSGLKFKGYTFPVMEIGVKAGEDDYEGQYSIFLKGKVEVSEKLPVSAHAEPVNFWMKDGQYQSVQFEALTVKGEVGPASLELTLEGKVEGKEDLFFAGHGNMTLAKKLNMKVDAGFGLQGGVGYGFAKASIAPDVTAKRFQPIGTINGLGFYEIHGGLAINAVWKDGKFDENPEPAMPEPGSMNVAVQFGTVMANVADQGKKFHVKATLGLDTTGHAIAVGDLYVGKSLANGALGDGKPNGRAKVDLYLPPNNPAQGSLTLEACVGPQGQAQEGNLDCSQVEPLKVFNVASLNGYAKAFIPFNEDQDFYVKIGTKQQPISLKLDGVDGANITSTGYLNISSQNLAFGVGLDYRFHRGDSGSFLFCDWHWNVDAYAKFNADFQVDFERSAMDAQVALRAGASAGAGGCGINLNASVDVALDGRVHVEQNNNYFDGTARAHVSLPVIPDIDFSVHVNSKF